MRSWLDEKLERHAEMLVSYRAVERVEYDRLLAGGVSPYKDEMEDRINQNLSNEEIQLLSDPSSSLMFDADQYLRALKSVVQYKNEPTGGYLTRLKELASQVGIQLPLEFNPQESIFNSNKALFVAFSEISPSNPNQVFFCKLVFVILGGDELFNYGERNNLVAMDPALKGRFLRNGKLKTGWERGEGALAKILSLQGFHRFGASKIMRTRSNKTRRQGVKE